LTDWQGCFKTVARSTGGPMSLNKALEDLKFDKRLTELNIRLGRITQEEVDKHDAALEDLESQAEKLDLDSENAEIN